MPTPFTYQIGSGLDYESLSSYVSNEAENITAAGSDQIHTVECTAFTDTAGVVSLSAFTCDPTHTVTIKPASGAHHGGSFGAGYVLSSGSNTTVLEPGGTSDITITGIEVAHTSTVTNNSKALKTGTGARCVFDSLLLSHSSGGTSHGIRYENASTQVIRNVLAKGFGTGYAQNSNGITTTFQNCGAANCTTGWNIGTSSSGTVMTNCWAYNCTTPYNNSGNFSASSDHNATDEATTTNVPGSPGSNNVANLASTDFIDTTDFIVKSGGALDSAGADLSGSFTTSINDVTRTSDFDIGPSALAGGALPTVLILLAGS